MRWLFTGLVLGLAGCAEPDEIEDTDEEVADDCGVTIDSTDPSSDDADVFYRSSLRVTLSEEAEATLTLTGPDGEVPGTTSSEGAVITFTPDEALEPGASYELTVETCAGAPAVPFTVSPTGAEVSEQSVNSAVYALDLASGVWIEPQGVSSLIQQNVDQTLLLVPEALEDDLFFSGAITESGTTTQDRCVPSLTFPEPADFSENPFFLLQADDLLLQVAGLEVEIEAVELSGAFSPGADTMEGIRLTGLLDTEQPVFDELLEGEDVCSLVEAFNTSCEACPESGEETCLSIEVEQLVASSVDEVFEERTVADIEADSACQ